MRAPITVITVTIPGREHLLAETIQSVYAQSIPVTSHLICAHDITDEAPMIQYVRAKNSLLPAISTPWVAVLNDDDIWFSNHVATVLPYLNSMWNDVVYSWDAGGTRPRINVTSWPHQRLLDQMVEGNIIDGNALIRMSVLRQIGGFPSEWVGGSHTDGGHYRDSSSIFEDQEMWIRMLKKTKAQFRAVPVETWRYRVDTPDRIGGAT